MRSARSPIEKAPWKHLPALEEVVEEPFVKPMHSGATIVAYRPRAPQWAVVPCINGEVVAESDDRLDEFPGLAAWWHKAERLWSEHRASSVKMSLLERQDFQRGLRRQFPPPPHRVVYSASGQHLAACRIDDPDVVIEHKLYWAAVQSPEEARYLCAVLNSQRLADAVVGLQSRGQHNPRDFDTHVFALPFPAFDAESAAHRELAELAKRAEQVAATVELDDSWQFQKARRVTREALREDGVADDIDIAVTDLIEEAIAPYGETPDLMEVFSSMRRTADAHKARLGAHASPSTQPLHPA